MTGMMTLTSSKCPTQCSTSELSVYVVWDGWQYNKTKTCEFPASYLLSLKYWFSAQNPRPVCWRSDIVHESNSGCDPNSWYEVLHWAGPITIILLHIFVAVTFQHELWFYEQTTRSDATYKWPHGIITNSISSTSWLALASSFSSMISTGALYHFCLTAHGMRPVHIRDVDTWLNKPYRRP